MAVDPEVQAPRIKVGHGIGEGENSFAVRVEIAQPSGKAESLFITATVDGAPVNGAVGDLQGDGFGTDMSSAPQALGSSNGNSVPTAFISVTITQANLAGLSAFYPTTLAASGSALISATSSSFLITPGAPSQLRFTTQPVGAMAGSSMSSSAML